MKLPLNKPLEFACNFTVTVAFLITIGAYHDL
jgi:hypothetical protein